VAGAPAVAQQVDVQLQFLTASHDGKRSRRRRYATSRLRSFVLCDSTVNTSSAIGSPCGSISGMP
jgi:hypothetical protein